jgi:hypothetical protein
LHSGLSPEPSNSEPAAGTGNELPDTGQTGGRLMLWAEHRWFLSVGFICETEFGILGGLRGRGNDWSRSI